MDVIIEELPLEAMTSPGKKAAVSARVRGGAAPAQTSPVKDAFARLFGLAVNDFRQSVKEPIFRNGGCYRKSDIKHFLIVAYRVWIAVQNDRESFDAIAKRHGIRFATRKRNPLFHEVLRVLYRAAGLWLYQESSFSRCHGTRLAKLHDGLLREYARSSKAWQSQPTDDELVQALRSLLAEEHANKTPKQAAKSSVDRRRGEIVLTGHEEVDRSGTAGVLSVRHSDEPDQTVIEDGHSSPLLTELGTAVQKMIDSHTEFAVVAEKMDKQPSEDESIARRVRSALWDLHKVNNELRRIQAKYLESE